MLELNLGELSFNTVREDPLAFLESATRTDKGIVDILRYRVQGKDVVLLNHPDLVQGILRTHARSTSKSGTPDESMLAPLLGNGLLTASGEKWRTQRIALSPLFRRARVAEFDHIIMRAVDELCDSWSSALNREISVEHELSSFTLSVLVRAIFGIEIPQLGAGFGKAVQDVNSRLGHRDPREGDFHSNKAYQQACTLLHGLTDALLAAFGPSAATSAEFLKRLAQASTPKDLHDQVLTLIMAGHETTAKVLCWALLELGGNPALQDRLEIEARKAAGSGPITAEHIEQLPLATEVFSETLRLHPPVWLMSRTTTKDITMSGMTISEGTLVTFSQYLLQRDPRWWDNPELFVPERQGPKHQFAYFPFGGGERLCIGRHLAELEGVLTLSSLMRQLRFTRQGPMPEPQALVTLRPVDGAKICVGLSDGKWDSE